MGKIVKPRYRVEGWELIGANRDGSLVRNRIACVWYVKGDCQGRGDGKPTAENLAKWRRLYLSSFVRGGANEHLGPIAPNVGTLRIIDQRNGNVVAEDVPQAFQVIP